MIGLNPKVTLGGMPIVSATVSKFLLPIIAFVQFHILINSSLRHRWPVVIPLAATADYLLRMEVVLVDLVSLCKPYAQHHLGANLKSPVKQD